MDYPQLRVRHPGRAAHYYIVAAKHIQSIPPGQWLLAAWRRTEGEPLNHTNRIANAIREGCVRGDYWLRAYAVLPARLALLLYPLGDAAELLIYLDTLAGGAPERLRVIQNDAELERAAHYVESLPVRSHLAARPEDYPLSSVGWIRRFGPAGGQRAKTITPQGL